MGESLGDILKRRGNKQNEPEDFIIIRKFIQDRYSVTPKLNVSKAGITITVPNSGIAGNLRFDLYDIQQLLEQKTRLIIRIGRTA
jgi:hypothetical protein